MINWGHPTWAKIHRVFDVVLLALLAVILYTALTMDPTSCSGRDEFSTRERLDLVMVLLVCVCAGGVIEKWTRDR